MKVVLITGASSGIGRETAISLQEKGYNVYGVARNKKKLEELEKYHIKTLICDVTCEKSMTSCVNTILEKEKKIDILINNAGYGAYGAVEDVPIEDARKQIEVNLFGLARMTQLVLPSMRKNKFGRIINISSMAGKVHTPFGAWYHASKFAIEGFSDSLRVEVKPFGIDVVVIEPGSIMTPWGGIAADNLEKSSSKGAYFKSAKATADKFRSLYSKEGQASPVKLIVKELVKATTKKRPKTRYIKGYGAKLSINVKRFLGDRGYDYVLRKIFKIS